MSPPLTSSWVSGGEPVSVVTDRLPEETQPEHEARHAAAVASMQEDWPPDP